MTKEEQGKCAEALMIMVKHGMFGGVDGAIWFRRIMLEVK